VQVLWCKPEAEAVFSLEQHARVCPGDKLYHAHLPPCEELFWEVLWSSVPSPLPRSASHAGIALGIPTALEDADGDLPTGDKICLKCICSSSIQLVKALNISAGFLS